MNILLVGNYLYNKANSKNVWHDLAHHLQEAGFKVITTSGKKNKILRLMEMLYSIWKYRKYYQVAQVNVFSGQAFVWSYLSVRLLKILKKPVILTLHGGNLPAFSLRYPNHVRWLLNIADAVTTPSLYLQDALIQFRDSIKIIPNAIDVENYLYFQRNSSRPIIIWLRAFDLIYNPELAIQVLNQLHKIDPAVKLIMIGPDKGDGSLQSLQKLVLHLGLENIVEFPGAVLKSEVPFWLNKGDIFINTTNYDNTPISVLEAMACGLCVVSTNVGGIPYLFTNEKNALLVPADDINSMTKAVLRIMKEPGLSAVLSENGRKLVEQFDWKIILPMWLELFTKILQQEQN